MVPKTFYLRQTFKIMSVTKEKRQEELEHLVFRKLKVEKLFQQYSINLNLMEDSAAVDYCLDRVLLRLSARVLTETKECVTIEVPTNWWEHFKKDCFPKWLLHEFPVKYRISHYDFKIKYPHYRLNHETLGRGYLEIIESKHEYHNLYST